MADANKRLAGPVELTTSAATVYTVPGGGAALLLFILLSNKTAVDQRATVSIGAMSNDDNVIVPAVLVPANEAIPLAVWLPMTSAEIVQAKADLASAINLTVAGIETT